MIAPPPIVFNIPRLVGFKYGHFVAWWFGVSLFLVEWELWGQIDRSLVS